MRPSAPIPSYGKETTYRGVTFRSRIEARWAAVFDLLGLEWEYEPNGAATFPDFKLDGDTWVEVKAVELVHGFDWLHHGDARKARRDCYRAKMRGGTFFVAGSDGYMCAFLTIDEASKVDRRGSHPADTLEKHEKGLSRWSNPVQFAAQDAHHWDRALVMVSGRGKV